MNLILFLRPSVSVFSGLLSLPLAKKFYFLSFLFNVFVSWFTPQRMFSIKKLTWRGAIRTVSSIFFPKILSYQGVGFIWLKVGILLHDHSEWSYYNHEYIIEIPNEAFTYTRNNLSLYAWDGPKLHFDFPSPLSKHTRLVVITICIYQCALLVSSLPRTKSFL